MTRGGDLASLFEDPPAGPSQTVGYRQGVLTDWDPPTNANTVHVGGAFLTNLPVLTSAVAHMTPGAVVALITVGSTFMILGPITTPA